MAPGSPALAAAHVPPPADSADFDWRPVTLAEVAPPPGETPDSQPVLEEEAREDNPERSPRRRKTPWPI